MGRSSDKDRVAVSVRLDRHGERTVRKKRQSPEVRPSRYNEKAGGQRSDKDWKGCNAWKDDLDRDYFSGRKATGASPPKRMKASRDDRDVTRIKPRDEGHRQPKFTESQKRRMRRKRMAAHLKKLVAKNHAVRSLIEAKREIARLGEELKTLKKHSEATDAELEKMKEGVRAVKKREEAAKMREDNAKEIQRNAEKMLDEAKVKKRSSDKLSDELKARADAADRSELLRKKIYEERTKGMDMREKQMNARNLEMDKRQALLDGQRQGAQEERQEASLRKDTLGSKRSHCPGLSPVSSTTSSSSDSNSTTGSRSNSRPSRQHPRSRSNSRPSGHQSRNRAISRPARRRSRDRSNHATVRHRSKGRDRRRDR